MNFSKQYLSLYKSAIDTTWRSQSNLHKLLKINGRQHKYLSKEWRIQRDGDGNAPTRTTATKRYNEQNHRTDLHTEAHHSNIGHARLYQCKHVVAEIRTVHKNDEGLRSINNDKQQRDTVINWKQR